MKRKIDRMHELFGVTQGKKCKDCEHLHGGVNEYRKCLVYGNTCSEATDWALKYDACGLWNKPYEGDVPIVKLIRANKSDVQVEGQLSMFGG